MFPIRVLNEMLACPECKSTELRKFGWKWVRLTQLIDGRTRVNHYRTRRQQYICKKCGRITVNPITPQPRDDKGRFIKTSDTSCTSLSDT